MKNMKRLFEIYSESTRPTKLITIPLLLLSAIAFLILPDSPIVTTAFSYLLHIAPQWVWSTIFLGLAAIRIKELFGKKPSIFCQYFAPTGVVWVWSMIVTGVLLHRPIISTGLIYLIPILVELWFIARTVEDHLNESNRLSH
jgi:hypothetical protein